MNASLSRRLRVKRRETVCCFPWARPFSAMKILLPLVALVFLLFTAPPLRAQTAAELAKEGQRAMMGGDNETAKMKFKLALEMDRNNVAARNFLRMIAAQEAKAGVGGTLEKQLGGLVLDRVEFRAATFREALDFLKQKAAAQNVAVSFVSQLPPEAAQRPVTLSLSRVPFTEALRYLCEANGAKYSVEKYAMVITPAGGAASGPAAAQ